MLCPRCEKPVRFYHMEQPAGYHYHCGTMMMVERFVKLRAAYKELCPDEPKHPIKRVKVSLWP